MPSFTIRTTLGRGAHPATIFVNSHINEASFYKQIIGINRNILFFCQISGIGNLPLNENLALTGRLGYSINKTNSQTPTSTLTNTEVSPNGTVMNTVRLDTVHTSDSRGKAVLGVGIKYKLTNNSELRAEYSAISHISSSDISTLMIGLAYRFK